jgi:AcrR family transcriptional regulator
METQEVTMREHIIQTASRLFHEQGYNLTGVNQIIEEAGIAKASLYYHFPSKEDLCVAYLQWRNEKWFSELFQYLRLSDDPKMRIIRTFDFRAIHLRNNSFGGCSCIKIISELPMRGKKIRRLSGVQKKDCVTLTDRIFLFFDGGTVQCQVYRSPDPLYAARNAVADLLERY